MDSGAWLGTVHGVNKEPDLTELSCKRVCVNASLPVCPTLLFPVCVNVSLLCICASIPDLQIGKCVPFFWLPYIFVCVLI